MLCCCIVNALLNLLHREFFVFRHLLCRTWTCIVWFPNVCLSVCSCDLQGHEIYWCFLNSPLNNETELTSAGWLPEISVICLSLKLCGHKSIFLLLCLCWHKQTNTLESPICHLSIWVSICLLPIQCVGISRLIHRNLLSVICLSECPSVCQ